MKYAVNTHEKYTILTIQEEKLDAVLSPQLKSVFITTHAQEEDANIILDLSMVKYVDSSGLSAILIAHRLCHETKGIFVLVAPSEHVMKLIKISQLDKILTILPTVPEAIDTVFMHEIEKGLEEDV